MCVGEGVKTHLSVKQEAEQLCYLRQLKRRSLTQLVQYCRQRLLQ